MEKMGDKERFNYVAGLVDMLSYQAVLADNHARAECIADAFYKRTDETWQLMTAAFQRFSDQGAEKLVVVLMQQACGS